MNFELRKKIYDAYSGICNVCGNKVKLFQSYHGDPGSAAIDHIFPKSEGGTDDESNLQLLCRICNSRKYNKIYTLSIVNWENYQHYKKRNPPWIKLYHSLLDNYEYSCLQDDSKLLLISLFMLASKKNNMIPYDPMWIKSKSVIKGDIDISELLKYGFLRVNEFFPDDDSNLIASCYQTATPETETEAE